MRIAELVAGPAGMNTVDGLETGSRDADGEPEETDRP
jgi:hypothetical protein